MARFKCIKCGNGYSGSSQPSSGKCSKGGVHRWVADGFKTSRRWKCTKCGNGYSGMSHPLIGTCSKGGGHQWHLV
jgi:rubredoxin